MLTLRCIVTLSAVAAVFAVGHESFINDTCIPNPCQNGGECRLVLVDRTILTYSCKCPPNYAGVNCRIYSQPRRPTITASWPQRECSSDDECAVALEGDLATANADRQPRCFKEQCLCPVGLYYSVGQKFCVKYCHPNDLQPTFTIYPNSGIWGHNDYTWKSQSDSSQCTQDCAKESDCKNFETNGKVCYGARVNMVKGVRYTLDVRNWNHYQRDCA